MRPTRCANFRSAVSIDVTSASVRGSSARALEEGGPEDGIVALHRRVDGGLERHGVRREGVGGGVLARRRGVVAATVGGRPALVGIVRVGFDGRSVGVRRRARREACAHEKRDGERAHADLIS